MTESVVYGIDISAYNPGVDLSSLKEQDYHFVTARCSIGTQKDELYAKHLQDAAANKLAFAAYHYVLATVDVAAQAEACKNAIQDISIPLMVDFEEGPLSNLVLFLHYAHAQGLNVKSLYFPHWYWQECQSPDLSKYGLALVNSDYENNQEGWGSQEYDPNSLGWNGYGGVTPTILQFGSKIDVAAQDTTDHANPVLVDADAFKGTLADLAALGLFHDFGALVAPAPAPAPKPVPAPVPTRSYVVQENDTLWAIAEKFGESLSTLEEANPQIKNPNEIYPGEIVHVVGKGNPFRSYTVQSGDNLTDIAAKFHIGLQSLESANPQIKNPDVIFVGEIIHIPGE